MDFSFSNAENAWRNEVRDFFAGEIRPGFIDRLVAKQKCSNPHSQELYLKMAARGWLGLFWSPDYGGQGRPLMDQAIFLEEAALEGCPAGTLNVMGNTTYYLAGIILGCGSEEQKRRLLPMIAAGQIRSCMGQSEPNAGSDLASVEMRAVREGDFYVLNGTKIFSNAHNATHMFTVCRTDPAAPKHRGLSLFLVDLASPGVAISALYTAGGMRRNEVSFDNVRVPASDMLGAENRGWYNMAAGMGFQRSQAIGVARLQTNFAELIDCVKRLSWNGRPLSAMPAVRYSLANLATEIEVARLLSYWVVWSQSQGRPVAAKEAPMAKVYRSEVDERFANTVVDILGRYGQLEAGGADDSAIPMGGKAAELYRDSRTEQIGGGTTEIHLNVIAQRGLGLPRGKHAEG